MLILYKNARNVRFVLFRKNSKVLLCERKKTHHWGSRLLKKNAEEEKRPNVIHERVVSVDLLTTTTHPPVHTLCRSVYVSRDSP